MPSPLETAAMGRIAKRAAMLKEISGIAKPVAELSPEQSWNTYRTIDKARCHIKCAQLDSSTLHKAVQTGRGLLGLDTDDPRPGMISRAKTRFMINRAKRRLARGDFDVAMQSGRNRVMIPSWEIDEAALPYAGFQQSLMAIPERGQAGIMTYRDPKEYYHLHRHKDDWFMHQDKFPSVNQAMQHVRETNPAPIEEVRELGRGVKHVTTEGLPGLYYYLLNLATNSPTMEDVAKGRVPEVPMAAASMSGGMGKKAELVLELAHTRAEQVRGLSGRTRLPDDYGMLFTKAGAYWMKGVPFDLDIMFLDKTGQVLDWTTMKALRKDEYPEIYTSKSAEAAMAVEVPAGWCARRGVEQGDRLQLDNTDN